MLVISLQFPKALLDDVVVEVFAASVVRLASLRHELPARTIFYFPYVFWYAYLGDLRRVAHLDSKRVHEILLLVIRPQVRGVIFEVLYLLSKFGFQNFRGARKYIPLISVKHLRRSLGLKEMVLSDKVLLNWFA